ncbi:MAG: hypothetical protein HJJLKODD_02863 [Phycisphaerae bacterium]|nr:hypothetical protein [Phycisphaerae bacterium]
MRVLICGIVLSALSGCGHQSTSDTTADHRAGVLSPNHRAPSGEPMIRILLLENTPRFEVEINGSYQIFQGQHVLRSGRRLPRSVVQINPSAGPTLLIGQEGYNATEIILLPQRDEDLRIYFPAAANQPTVSRRYDGGLTISVQPASATAGPSLRAINVVPLESYLAAVIHAELYARFHLETFRAQSIAARTFALYQMQTIGQRQPFDVRATEQSQMYQGVEGLTSGDAARRAVQDTRGLVCTWASPGGQKIFPTYYSSACGGLTQDVATCLDQPTIPPLAGGMECTYCQIGGAAYRWGPVRINKSEITERLKTRFPAIDSLGQVTRLQPAPPYSHRRPVNYLLEGETGRTLTLNAYDVRLALGGHRLKSTACQIRDLGNELEFTEGCGFGHGVGMCQWGAEGQARLGRKAPQIITFYYPHSTIIRAY